MSHFTIELAELVDLFCEGDIAPDQAARLEALVAESDEVRQHLLDCFQVHCELAWELRRESAGLDREDPADRAAVSCRPETKRKRHRGWMLAAMTVGLLVAVALGLRTVFRSGSRKTESQASSVARIEQMKDVRWGGAMAPAIDAPLAAGSKLAFQQGLLQAIFDGGARIILQGPVEVELQSPASALLLRGNLTAEVPAGARGFAIHTPNATVVDLGTRFGIACQAGQTDVEVFAGRVLLQFPETRSEGGPQDLPLVANSAVRVSGVPGHGALKIEQLAAGSRHFVQSLTGSAVPVQALAGNDPHSIHSYPFEDVTNIAGLRDRQGNRVPIDLSHHYTSAKSGQNENNQLELAAGTQRLAGVEFQIGNRMIELQGQRVPIMPPAVQGIPVHRRIARLYVLHATEFGTNGHGVRDGDQIAEYRVRYADGDLAAIPVIVGQDVRDWWGADREQLSRGQIAWVGNNKAALEHGCSTRLYLSTWKNPQPEKTVESIDYVSMKTNAAPFCLAITAEEPQSVGHERPTPSHGENGVSGVR